MAVQSQASQQPSGLTTVLNVLVAPREAFLALRDMPMWGWAFIIATLLGIIGSLLAGPATQHAVMTNLAAQIAHDPQFAQMTPDKQRQAMAFTSSLLRFGWIATPFYILLATLIQTVIMLIGNTIARGPATFKQLWAAAMNISVVDLGIAYLFVGLIATLRGPQSFSNTASLATALPSVAWAAPHAGIKTITFLSAINPFSLWGVFLIAAALLVMARAPKPLAYRTAIFFILCSGALSASFAR